MKKRTAALALGVLLGACSRNPSSVLNHAGPHAAWIGWLFWFFFIICGLVWTSVLGMLAIAIRRGLSRRRVPDSCAEEEALLTKWVGGGVALTVLILTILVGASYAVDTRLIALDRGATREIEVTGRQWWWEIRYLDAEPGRQFVTANELHVPVGETVKLILKSNDVIHSVWIPNVAGKRDIIPGQENILFIRVDRAGKWEGRCAEFCGYQHAFMGLAVIATPAEVFEKWRIAQLAQAREPEGEEEKAGQQVFKQSACAVCHAIRSGEGSAYSSNAPDLTHLKSRETIGAGTAPNTKGHLGGWILDPHGLKPGVHMPVNLQNAAEFQSLLAYLETLR
jgi:cytochrome c oxidase subunit II